MQRQILNLKYPHYQIQYVKTALIWKSYTAGKLLSTNWTCNYDKRALLQHGRAAMKKVASELRLIANSLSLFLSPFFSAHGRVQFEWGSTSWIYKQAKAEQKKQRPDIIFNVSQNDDIMEIGCGGVKKADVSESLITEARIRVLETMKCQLHLCLKHACDAFETAIILYIL
jgi:hypothetical protein